jgi:hypothetical protein
LNFCLFWPIMQIRKKGDVIKKKLLLWNYWANLNQTCRFGHLKKFLFLVMAAILDTGRRWRTQFWKETTHGSSQQSLVEIGSVVSEKIFFNSFAYFDRLCKLEKRGGEIKRKLLWNYWANLNQTLLRWSLGVLLSKLCLSNLHNRSK